MTTNLEKFKDDIQKLIKQGETLAVSLRIYVEGKEGFAKINKLSAEQEKAIDKLPYFPKEYESWYSESIALIRQVLPDRLSDFREHFEIPKNRKEISFATYRIQDALKGTEVTRGGYETLVDRSASIPHFQQQLAIIEAAARRFDSSLYDIRQIVQADILDGEIATARELLKNKYTRAAGAICGVVLEKHLKTVCDNHKITIAKKNPGINDMNQMLKDSGIIDVPQWRHISLLGDIRNLCDHAKNQEPTPEQVKDLIDGTDKVTKTIF
jgi:hypothetical protein